MCVINLPPLSAIDKELSRRGLPVPGQVWPYPGPQMEAFNHEAFELLYGGKPRGGKSFLALMLAKYRHTNSLLLRRTFPDLERGLILDSLGFYGSPNNYNASKHVWNLGGRRVEFSHLQHDKDVYQYQGAAYDLIVFDELTQFTRNQYLYLFSRVVPNQSGQRCRIVATSNPGGEGNAWVVERWAAWLDPAHPNPAKPGELRWYVNMDEKDTEVSGPEPIEHKGKMLYPKSRTYIPASVEDNPFINAEEYNANLQQLPEPYRSQLLGGDWSAGMVEDAYQVIPRGWIRQAVERGRKMQADANLSPVLGVDIARGGDDKTVIAIRRGNLFTDIVKIPGVNTPTGNHVAGLIAQYIGDGVANLDIIGVGASAFDIASSNGLRVNPVNFAEKTYAKDRHGLFGFANLRAEAYWRLREALDPDNPDAIGIPEDHELIADLAATRSEPMTMQGMKIEPKDKIKERIGRSPDTADAMALACLERFNIAEYSKLMKAG